MIVVGLCGYSRSGKDTAAKILERKYGFKRYAFADALREKILKEDPIIENNKGDKNPLSRWIELSGCFYGQTIWDWLKENTKIVPVLQNIGQSERNEDPNYWIKIVAKKIIDDGRPTRVVVSDVRYQNELEWIKNNPYFNGLLFKVDRGNGPVNGNPIESQFTSFVPDKVIKNFGDIEFLSERIEEVANEYGF